MVPPPWPAAGRSGLRQRAHTGRIKPDSHRLRPCSRRVSHRRRARSPARQPCSGPQGSAQRGTERLAADCGRGAERSEPGGWRALRIIQSTLQTRDQGQHRFMTAQIRAADEIQPFLGQILDVEIQIHAAGQGPHPPLPVGSIKRNVGRLRLGRARRSRPGQGLLQSVHGSRQERNEPQLLPELSSPPGSSRHRNDSPAWNGTSSTELPAASLPCRRGGTTWLSRTSVTRCSLGGRP